MSGRVHRQIRKTAAEVSQQNAKMLIPGMKAAWDKATDAIKNDEIHAGRLDDLEAAVRGHLTMTFAQRVRWLFTGEVVISDKPVPETVTVPPVVEQPETEA